MTLWQDNMRSRWKLKWNWLTVHLSQSKDWTNYFPVYSSSQSGICNTHWSINLKRSDTLPESYNKVGRGPPTDVLGHASPNLTKGDKKPGCCPFQLWNTLIGSRDICSLWQKYKTCRILSQRDKPTSGIRHRHSSAEWRWWFSSTPLNQTRLNLTLLISVPAGLQTVNNKNKATYLWCKCSLCTLQYHPSPKQNSAGFFTVLHSKWNGGKFQLCVCKGKTSWKKSYVLPQA